MSASDQITIYLQEQQQWAFIALSDCGGKINIPAYYCIVPVHIYLPLPISLTVSRFFWFNEIWRILFGCWQRRSWEPNQLDG